VAQAAERADVSERTIRKRVQAGDIASSRAIREGRAIITVSFSDVARLYPEAVRGGPDGSAAPKDSGTVRIAPDGSGTVRTPPEGIQERLTESESARAASEARVEGKDELIAVLRGEVASLRDQVKAGTMERAALMRGMERLQLTEQAGDGSGGGRIEAAERSANRAWSVSRWVIGLSVTGLLASSAATWRIAEFAYSSFSETQRAVGDLQGKEVDIQRQIIAQEGILASLDVRVEQAEQNLLERALAAEAELAEIRLEQAVRQAQQTLLRLTRWIL
jgi:hypothetical protein